MIDPDPDARGLRIGIVVSSYNASITDRLLDGAVAEFGRLGGDPAMLTVARVPGAFELPIAAIAACVEHDAVVALGCLIRGETQHDRVIADAVAQGLTRVALEMSVPVTFGVLTVDTMAQAEERSRAVGAPGAAPAARDAKQRVDNKGAEAMHAAVRTALAMKLLMRNPDEAGRGAFGGID